MLEDAIEIAAGMGSPERLAEVVARHGSHLAERDDWRRLEAWLALLPRDVVESSPDLLVLEAWVAGELLENPVEMRDRLTRAESLIASARPGLAVLPATSASIEGIRPDSSRSSRAIHTRRFDVRSVAAPTADSTCIAI